MIKINISSKIFSFFRACLVYISFFLASYEAQASIENVLSFKNFPICSEDFNENTLVIFDVDDVLLTEEDQILRGNLKAKKYLKSLLFELDKKMGPLSPKQWEKLKAEILLSSKRHVLEQEVVPLIKNMQKKGAKVIVLTACQTGACGSIASLPEWRIKELCSYDMNFKHALPKINSIMLEALDFKKDKKPFFKKGCLFSTGYAKGLVLKHFLKYLKQQYPEWQPKQIIFFDNQEDNLQSVREISQHLSIPYKGYLYTFSENLAQMDPELARYQIHYLFKYKKWLTDTKARAERTKNY